MSNLVSARYATAFVEATLMEDSSSMHLDSAVSELGTTCAYITQDNGIASLVENCYVPSTIKQEIVCNVVKELSVSKLVASFLFVLVQHKRLYLIGSIIEQIKAAVLRSRGFITLSVTLACAVDKKERDVIVREIEEVFNFKAEATFNIDKQIIAGMVLRFDSKVIDLSMRDKLRRLRDCV